MQHPLKFPFVIILLECYVYVYVSFKMLIIKNGSILSNVVQTWGKVKGSLCVGLEAVSNRSVAKFRKICSG